MTFIDYTERNFKTMLQRGDVAIIYDNILNPTVMVVTDLVNTKTIKVMPVKEEDLDDCWFEHLEKDGIKFLRAYMTPEVFINKYKDVKSETCGYTDSKPQVFTLRRNGCWVQKGNKMNDARLFFGVSHYAWKEGIINDYAFHEVYRS